MTPGVREKRAGVTIPSWFLYVVPVLLSLLGYVWRTAQERDATLAQHRFDLVDSAISRLRVEVARDHVATCLVAKALAQHSRTSDPGLHLTCADVR